MTTLLIVVHVIVCFFLIAIVLLQHGKGADIGATFGGSSQSLFGTEGPVPLLHKITTGAAIIFMLTSVTLAYYSANKSTGSVMSKVPVQEQTVPASQEATPAAPDAAQPAAPVSVPATTSDKAAEETTRQKTEEAVPAKTQQSAPADNGEKEQSAVPSSRKIAPVASPDPPVTAKAGSTKKQAETTVHAEKLAKETSKSVTKETPAPQQKVEIQKGAVIPLKLQPNRKK